MTNIEKSQLIGLRFVLIFCFGFVLTLPFPYQILPDLGGLIAPVFSSINKWWIENVFGLHDVTIEILSDTTGLYVHLITLTLLASIGTLIWWLIAKWRIQDLVWTWFHRCLAYYLALTLLTYGFNKVFKWQFFFPEPNTLFTKLGELSPDILYWSAIGTSHTYSVFSGLIEVIPALLLFFRKTRLLGALISVMVLLNVVMINFGFDISVKVYALFLLFISLIIISPNLKTIYDFFAQKQPVTQVAKALNFQKKSHLFMYAIGKPLIIGLILFEVLFPYFSTQNFNDDIFEKPPFHGAYAVKPYEYNLLNTKIFKRVFIHRKSYFIIQYQDERFESLKLNYDLMTQKLELTDDQNNTHILNLTPSTQQNHQLVLEGILNGEHIKLKLEKIPLDQLPIRNNGFHWTIDQY